MYAVVAGIGFPAAFRNPTSAALVLAWLVPEILYQFTGDSLPLRLYFCADIFVLAAILAKATVREGCRTYPTLRQQTHCAWKAITPWDRLIAGGFILAAWPLYVAQIDPLPKWYALWAIIILQFLVAAGDAAFSLGERKRRVMSDTPGGPPGLAFAARFGGSV